MFLFLWLNFFNIFPAVVSIIMIITAFLAIKSKNPVHAVLGLVLVFIEAAFVLFLLKIEFLSLIFIVIYVGAIAILFLFVIMMIDVKASKIDKYYLPSYLMNVFLYMLFGIGLIFILEKSILVFPLLTDPKFSYIMFSYVKDSAIFVLTWIFKVDNLNNLKCIGQFLYTYYFIHFLMSGFLLLIGMMGPIVLTLQTNTSSKNQFIHKQLSRQSNSAIFLTTNPVNNKNAKVDT